jgi:hypothetical protein
MRFISTRVHGILDYLMGALLILSPWLFNFDNGGAETWIPVIVGIVILIQALMTNFEMGVFKTISMATHLRMDFIIGIFLAASPWLFDFDEYIWEPHVIFGLMALAASLMTRTVPDYIHSRHTVNNPVNHLDNRL